jgi:hypothetical protein
MAEKTNIIPQDDLMRPAVICEDIRIKSGDVLLSISPDGKGAFQVRILEGDIDVRPNSGGLLLIGRAWNSREQSAKAARIARSWITNTLDMRLGDVPAEKRDAGRAILERLHDDLEAIAEVSDG